MLKTIFDLHTLLHPQKIAIVGLSSNPNHISYSLLQNIVDNGYQGIVYPVNPSLKAVKGIKCYQKITDIPELVDLAIIILKPDIAIEIMEESAKMGIKNFIIIASGFAESGFVEQEQKILNLAEKYNLTILGPNCVGIINTHYNLNASFATKGLPKQGKISIISQSGGFSIGIIKYLTKMKQGISKLISVGNKTILQESHFLDYLANDENTSIIALYVEDIKNFQDFENSAYKLLEIGKPIVVFKGGITTEGSKASSSHTAAITENNDYYKALFHKTNCIIAETIEELYFVISTLEKSNIFSKPKGKRVMIISNCGGCGVINTDFAIKHNLEVPETSEELKQELRKILPPAAALNNPIDVVGDTDHIRLEKAIRTVMKFRNEYDYLIINIGQQSTINMEEVSKTIYNLSFELEKEEIPTLSCMFALDISQKEYDYLHLSKIPVFVYPEQLTKTIQLIQKYTQNRTKILQKQINVLLEDIDINWNQIKQIISQDTKVNGFISPLNVIEILKTIKVDIPNSQEYQEDLSIDFPVVLKTASPNIIHKTEQKGIYLNIQNQHELKQKAKLLEKLHPKIIVQKMIPNDIELILGLKKSKNLKKTLLLIGIGGIMVEIFKKFEVGLLPIDELQLDMILENLNLSRLFLNFRNKNYNKKILLENINKLSELILKLEEIEEIEVNPLIINEEGTFIVDCRIKCYQ